MVAGLRNQILFNFKDFVNRCNHPNLYAGMLTSLEKLDTLVSSGGKSTSR
jgi:hypothetical protein